MKAIALIKYGEASAAFKMIESAKPQPKEDEVLIKVLASGLNFADVMARRNMYKDAPPLPAVLGYDVTGIVESVGNNVHDLKTGDRVAAMTRFGGYAEYAVTKASATAVIPNEVDDAAATALTTQYCTAYYMAAEMINLHENDKVLIHAGAGGVGTALIQYAAYKKCEIISTAGSDKKLKYLSSLGVQHTVNYREQDFEKEITKITGNKGVDVIFDAVGGSSVKKGFRSLSPAGRIVCYGASEMSNQNIFKKLSSAVGFGFYHPVMLMMPSKSIIGVNMLRIADNKPEVLQRCLANVMQLTRAGIFKPFVNKIFSFTDIAAAHSYLENRESIGKVAIQWK